MSRCPRDENICGFKHGVKKFTIYKNSRLRGCASLCVEESRVQYFQAFGYTCDSCQVDTCPTAPCNNEVTSFNLFQKDRYGGCVKKCVEKSYVPSFLSKGFSCESCESVSSGSGSGSSGQDVCETCGKPTVLAFGYSGNDNSNNSQDGKFEVSGSVGGASSVFIVVGDKEGDDSYGSGSVDVGEVVTFEADKKFSANMFITVYSSRGGRVLQVVQFHASCSVPIIEGEQFGSLVLVGFIGKDGDVCFGM